jgi:pilus assembly protein Flp/PilA
LLGTTQAALVNQEWAMLRITNILRCRNGGAAIEFALVAVLIAVAAIAAFQNLGNKIGNTYSNVENSMP